MLLNNITGEKTNYSDEQMNIFLNALFLFSTYGYENVAIGSLAKAAKVKVSALYYMGGKSGLLASCYKYFLDHCYDTRMTPEEYEHILKEGTKEDVINCLLYIFPDSIIENMFRCLIIIITRLYIDDEAKKIYTNDIDQSMEYLRLFFETGINIGRFEPFDVKTVSIMCVSFRLFGLQLAITKHEKIEKWNDIEGKVFNEIKKLIPFKY